MEHHEFKLHSDYEPTGDQPHAIDLLVAGFKEGNQFETLLGVTGSGKTFTMANVIQAVKKPTLIISHNKTLAAQLYSEMKELFRRMLLNILCATLLKMDRHDISRKWIFATTIYRMQMYRNGLYGL